MDAPLLRTPEVDVRQQAPVRDNVVQIVLPERVKRRGHFEEHLSVGSLGTTELQVVD